jgi:CRP/FNR family transcriptional regulator
MFVRMGVAARRRSRRRKRSPPEPSGGSEGRIIGVDSRIAQVLASTPIFRRIPAEDRARLAPYTRIQDYRRGEQIFSEGSPSDRLYIIASGRVKVFKTTPAGKDVILEIFGVGDPLGAVAVYEGWPFPASAVAVDDTSCLAIERSAFFKSLEMHPTLVRGLLLGLTYRLVELTNRLTELTGGRVEPRFARLFLKLAGEIGKPGHGGTVIPTTLSRQELADLTGTTIETAIRIMSRWGKQRIVLTERDGFVLLDPKALEAIAAA